MGWIDKRDEQLLLKEVASTTGKNKKTNPNDAVVGQRLSAIYSKHPYLPTGLALSLAEANADPETVDAIALKATTQKMVKVSEESQQALNTVTPPNMPSGIKDAFYGAVGKGLSWIGGNTLGRIGLVKKASRYFTATAESGPQYLANYFSRLTDTERGTNDIENSWASTSLGALLQHPELQGEGFSIGDKLEEKRVEKVRKYRWQLANGDSYTIGRGTANILFKPGSNPYNFLSGFIDAAIAWKSDPTNEPIDEIARANKLRKALPTIENLDELKAATKLAQGQAGLLSNAEEFAIDNSKFFNWIDNSRAGKMVVQQAAAETDELKILEGFGYRISPEQARRIAQTSDPDEIRGMIAEAAVRLSDETTEGSVLFATSTDQLRYGKMLASTVEKVPGYNHIKNSRWLSKAPKGSLLVNGTPQQKVDAIKNLKNWLNLHGMDPYSGDGKSLMESAFTWAGADGTRADANIMKNLYLGDEVAGKKGILQVGLETAGVKPETIQNVLGKLRSDEQLLRSYAFDSAGATNDHGMIMHLTQFMEDNELYQMLDELVPTKVTPDMGREQLESVLKSLQPGEVTIVSPLSVSQMLNNVVQLPDPRVIRRLMSNPFYSASKTGEQVGASKLLEAIQNDVWRPWALATLGFVMRNGFDAQTRIAMSGIASNSPIDYLLMAAGRRGLGTITGDTWKSAEAIPQRTIWRISRSSDPTQIRELLNDYMGLDMIIPDQVLDDLVEAGDSQAVLEIINRVRPDPENLEDYVDFTRSYSKYMVDDPRYQMSKLVEDGQFDVVDSTKDTFPQALIDQAGFINTDPFFRFAAQISHLPEDKQIDVVTKWLGEGTREAQRTRRTIIEAISNPLVANKASGDNKIRMNIAKVAEMSDRELVEAWYEVGAKSQVDIYTRGGDELRAFAGYNSVPVAPAEMIDEASALRLSGGEPVKPGDILVQESTEMVGDVEKQVQRTHLVLEKHTMKKGNAKIVKYKTIEVKDPGTAFSRKFDETTASPRAKQFAKDILRRSRENVNQGLDPLVPDYALLRVRTPVQKQNVDYFGIANYIPRQFFRFVVDPIAKNMERSPAWRQIYYNVIRENAKLLAPEEAQRVLDSIEEAARKAYPKTSEKDFVKAMQEYVGGKKVLDAIDEAANATGGAFGTLEQLEEYALNRAKLDAEELFFNNVERSNFTDAMRVAIPFGAAWAEIAGTYARAIVQNPSRLSRTNMVYRGLEEFDPDNDGRGFLWNDPISKVQMFAFPISGLGIKALSKLTGAEVPDTFLAAPTSRLSAGFSLIPSLGPVYQIAASEIFNQVNVPATDDFRKIVLPYGDASLTDLIPGSWSKLWSAFDADPTKLNTVYGNTYQDVFAHLASTGEYDLTSSTDVTRLDKDARAGARGLTLVRAISQFVGPTAGTPQYRYKKNAGEFYYVNEMTKAFSQFQNEDYESAVKKFVDAFGMNAIIYLSGKTKVDESYKGIESTEAFNRWERENSDLMSTFKNTAPFLAPGAFGELSMDAYSRQLNAGVLKDRDNRDRLADAQRRVGSALYKNIRNQYPDALSDGQRQKLRDYRKQIHKQFPGFPETVEFKVGEFDNFISDLGRLVQDPRTMGNKTRDSIWEYLKFRANTQAKLKRDYGVSINAEKSAGAIAARGDLFARGEALAKVNPDFRRIWEQELSSEVE